MLNILSRTLNEVRAMGFRIASPRRKALCQLPPGLYEYWARTAHVEFKGIPRDAFFFVRAADALLAFFECVKHADRPCGLPSKAADSVWHAWLRYAPASLRVFCERHFGRPINHVEAAAMAGGMTLPIAVSLVTARALEGLALAGPNVPRLFATDRALHMPDGFAWQVRGRRLVCSRMNRHGQPIWARRMHPAAEPAFLLAAGLIPPSAYEPPAGRERRADDRKTSNDDVTYVVDTADGEGGEAIGSGDGGGDGGSSCGGGCSGCGGGCGGCGG